MTTEADILKKFAVKSLGMTDAEFAALVYKKADDSDDMVLVDNAADLLLEKNQSKIGKIKDEKTEAFNNGHKKGLGESLSSFETKLKEELDFKSDLTGIDLVKAWGDSIRDQQPTEPTEDQVKKHPVYIKLENDAKIEKEEAVQAVQKEYEDFKGGITREKKFAEINTKAWEILTELKPVVEGKPGENQKRNFFNALGVFDYDNSNGTIIITDPNNNNNRVEDSQGNAKSFNQLVTETAKDYFVFAKQDPQDPSGNNNDPWKDDSVIKIESKEDFSKLMKQAAGDPAKEAKISKAWKVFNEK